MLDFTCTIDEINRKNIKIAILPLGSIEQHSTHLPVGTDCIISQAVASAVGEKIGAFVLPVLPVGTCYEHKRIGSFSAVWLRPKTLYNVLEDIILSLYKQGFDKIVLLPGHGGLFIVPPLTRELNANIEGLVVVSTEHSSKNYTEDITECKNDIHAGENETSLMLYLNDKYVKKDKMGENDFIPDFPRSFLNYMPISDLSKTGVWGKPSLATKEKGERLFRARVENCVEFINNTFENARKEEW